MEGLVQIEKLAQMKQLKQGISKCDVKEIMQIGGLMKMKGVMQIEELTQMKRPVQIKNVGANWKAGLNQGGGAN